MNANYMLSCNSFTELKLGFEEKLLTLFIYLYAIVFYQSRWKLIKWFLSLFLYSNCILLFIYWFKKETIQISV